MLERVHLRWLALLDMLLRQPAAIEQAHGRVTDVHDG